MYVTLHCGDRVVARGFAPRPPTVGKRFLVKRADGKTEVSLRVDSLEKGGRFWSGDALYRVTVDMLKSIGGGK